MTEGSKIKNSATIDGKEVKVRKGLSILDAANMSGIYIPTLCHLDNLEPYGGCRLCAVHVKKMKGFPTACTTPIEPGMEILTRTPELQKLRREILEFTLSEHPYTCLVCNDKTECTEYMHSTRKVSTITGCNFCTSNGDCELQDLVDYLELKEIKFPITYRGIPAVTDNPFYDLDYNLCILCGRCVRICNDDRNSNVLAFVERGNTTIVGTAFQESQAEAGCEFCGACVDVCPTGSISEKMGKWRGIPDKSVKTSCTICPVACEMNINTRDGQLINIGPLPGKRTDPPQLCIQGKFLPAHINHHPSRINTPRIKRNEKWVEVSWKEAFEFIASKLQDHMGTRFGLIASAHDTLEENYSAQKFARKVMQSNNVDIPYSYPDNEVLEVIHSLHTSHPSDLSRVEEAGTLLLLGLDASLSHPMLENRIRKAFGNGSNIISANSFPTRTQNFTSQQLHYNSGEEESFLLALLATLKRQSDITVSELDKAVSLLLNSREVMIIAGDRLFRNPAGGSCGRNLLEIFMEICKGRKCQILLPGHESNLYAAAFAGAHPAYLPGLKPLKKEATGLSGNEMIRNINENGITALMVMGDLRPHPNLEKLQLLIQCNMFITELSEFADILLPVADFLENEGHVLSLDGKTRKVRRAVKPPGNARTINWILAGIAAAMQESGFSNKPADEFGELKLLAASGEESSIQKRSQMCSLTPPQAAGNALTGFKSVVELSKKVQKQEKSVEKPVGAKNLMNNGKFPHRLVIRDDHLIYRGNSLKKLVPDLAQISSEGTIELPESLMASIHLKEGDQVRVITEYGESQSRIQPLPGPDGQLACLYPTAVDSMNLTGKLYPEEYTYDARIVKV